MNLTSSAASGAASNAQQPLEAGEGCDATGLPEPRCTGDPVARDAFERLLLAKRQPMPADEETPGAEGAPPMAWPGAAPARTVATAPAAAGVMSEPATGTRAVIETALQNSVPRELCPIAGTDRPAVWEASIGGAGGTVELRAERIVTQGMPPTWGLTIGAPALGADVATRHAPRLHDRLRKHGIDVDHVRIESELDDRLR